MYISFIRPILEYADVVWCPSNLYLINQIEKVQIEAARIISGGTKLTSLNELYRETGLQKLSDRRDNHKLILFYKMQHNLTPHYLASLVPNRFNDIHGYDTRHSDSIPLHL